MGGGIGCTQKGTTFGTVLIVCWIMYDGSFNSILTSSNRFRGRRPSGVRGVDFDENPCRGSSSSSDEVGLCVWSVDVSSLALWVTSGGISDSFLSLLPISVFSEDFRRQANDIIEVMVGFNLNGRMCLLFKHCRFRGNYRSLGL